MKRGEKKGRREQEGEVQTESKGCFFSLLSSCSSKSSCPEVEGRCLNFQKGQGPVSDCTGREGETKINEILHFVSHNS